MSDNARSVVPSDQCIGCDTPPFERNATITYHRADDHDPHLRSGYLCSFCRQQLEALLDSHCPSECEECEAPFPEAGRNKVMEYDEDGFFQGTVTICRRCLRERY